MNNELENYQAQKAINDAAEFIADYANENNVACLEAMDTEDAAQFIEEACQLNSGMEQAQVKNAIYKAALAIAY